MFSRIASENMDPGNCVSVNSLPNDKVLDLPKLKAFADFKINVTQKKKKNHFSNIFFFTHNVFKSLLS